MPAQKECLYLIPMRILQICVLLLGVNLLFPTVAIHFMDPTADDVVCELLEDFGEEEEEDGETSKDVQDSYYFRNSSDDLDRDFFQKRTSGETYQENNGQLRIIHLEVQTPPPRTS